MSTIDPGQAAKNTADAIRAGAEAVALGERLREVVNRWTNREHVDHEDEGECWCEVDPLDTIAALLAAAASPSPVDPEEGPEFGDAPMRFGLPVEVPVDPAPSSDETRVMAEALVHYKGWYGDDCSCGLGDDFDADAGCPIGDGLEAARAYLGASR